MRWQIWSGLDGHYCKPSGCYLSPSPPPHPRAAFAGGGAGAGAARAAGAVGLGFLGGAGAHFVEIGFAGPSSWPLTLRAAARRSSLSPQAGRGDNPTRRAARGTLPWRGGRTPSRRAARADLPLPGGG